MTPERAAQIAAAYGLPSLRVVGNLTSGGANRSWRVETNQQQQFFLKAFEVGAAGHGELEASILGHLNAEPAPEYRVQLLVRTLEGAPVFASPDRTYLLTRWQSGSAKPWQEFSADDWHTLGSTLGALHTRLRSLRLGALPVPSLSRRVTGLDRESESAKIKSHRLIAAQKEIYPLRRKADAYFGQRLLLLERFFPLLPRLRPEDEQLIHNDYTESNFVFDDGGSIMVTDWERAIRAAPEYDVVRGLVMVPIVAPGHAARFIEGYRRFSSIDPWRVREVAVVYLVEQALKHWPADSWLSGEEWGRLQFESNFEVIDSLATHSDQLLKFYEDNC